VADVQERLMKAIDDELALSMGAPSDATAQAVDAVVSEATVVTEVTA
jgi:hypothetical protein